MDCHNNRQQGSKAVIPRRRLSFGEPGNSEKVASGSERSDSRYTCESDSIPASCSSRDSIGESLLSATQDENLTKFHEILSDLLERRSHVCSVAPLTQGISQLDRLTICTSEIKKGLESRLGTGMLHCYEFDVRVEVAPQVITSASRESKTDMVYLYILQRPVRSFFDHESKEEKNWHMVFHSVFLVLYDRGRLRKRHLFIYSCHWKRMWTVVKSEFERNFQCLIHPVNIASCHLQIIAGGSLMASLPGLAGAQEEETFVTFQTLSMDHTGKKLKLTTSVPFSYFRRALDVVYKSKEADLLIDSKRLWIEVFNCINKPFPVDSKSHFVEISFPGFMAGGTGEIEVVSPSISCCVTLLNSLANVLRPFM